MKRNGESKYLFTNLLHAPLSHSHPVSLCSRRIADVFSQTTLPMISAVKYRGIKKTKRISTVASNLPEEQHTRTTYGTDQWAT